MESSLLLRGKKYVSARRGAEIAGYSSDYVGQLCRQRKVRAHRVGKHWFVCEKSLLLHKREQERLIEEMRLKMSQSQVEISPVSLVKNPVKSAQNKSFSLVKLSHWAQRFFVRNISVLSPKIADFTLKAVVLVLVFMNVFGGPAMALSLFTPSVAEAAVNTEINYQGNLTDAGGTAVADGSYNMQFGLYTASSGGAPIWTESLTGGDRVAVSSGLFSVMLGAISSLASVDFNQTLYLGVTIGGSGVSPSWDSEMTPRKILGAVPAAFEARRLEGLSASQFLRTDAVNSTSTASTFVSITQSGSGTALLVSGLTSLSNLLLTGSTTLQNVTATNATTTNLSVSNSLSVTGSATSSFAGGINLTSGCFAVNGTCLSTSGGGGSGTVSSGTANALAYYTGGTTVDDASALFWDNTNGRLGIGTTSPYAPLSVVGQVVASYFTATTTTASVFPYASTTAISASGTGYFGNLLTTASSTLQNFTALNSTTTNATSTSLFATVLRATTLALTNALGVTSGGTGLTSIASSSLLIGGANNTIIALATSSLGVALTDTTGTLGVSRGGTGVATFSYGLLVSAGGTSALTNIATSSLGLLTTDVAEGTNLYFTNARADTRIAAGITGTTTTALAEGTNLYFTNNRVASVIAGTTTDALAQGTTNKYYSTNLFATSLAGTTTTALTEGANLYFTNNRVASVIAGTTTTALAEGTNLYFTNARADSRVAADLAGTTTTALTEGANLYFTNARADARVVAGLAATTSVASITTLANLSLSATQLTNFGTPFYTFFHATTTDALAEGTTNKYYTDTRVASVIAGTTTTALAEGTNLYFTNNRFDARLSATTSLQGLTTLANLSTLGTVTSGVWNASVLGASYGGTGQSSYVAGDILYADGVSSLARLAPGSNGQVLKMTGGVPTWGTDLVGSGGGAGGSFFSTTTDSLAIFPTDITNVLILGESATTTSGNILEVVGNTWVSGVGTFGNLLTTASSTLQNFTALNSTTTNATSTSLFATVLRATTLALTNALGVTSGGTGLTSAPSYGQIFVGNSSNGYTLTATSSLGLVTTDVAEGSNLYFTNNRVASVIAGTTTTALAEGTNLYFTNTRADTRVAAGIAGTTTTAIAEGTNLYFTNNRVASVLSGTTTDALAQGSLNKYYSTTLFATDLAGTTTTALTEGTNLYFTNARADSRVATGIAGTTTTALAEGTNLYFTNNRVASVIAGTTTDALAQGSTNKYYSTNLFATDLAGTTTTALAEGTNLYYTTTRFDNRLSATTSLPNITTLSGLTSATALSLSATQLTNFGTPFYTFFHATTTDALAEGTTNKYYTDTRVASVIAGTTTTALAEGANLYFTNTRADTRVAAGIAGTTTTALAEGTNLYYTNSRVDSRIATVIAGTTTDALAQGAINKYYSTNLFAADLAGTTTTALLEGTNLYFTNDRVASVIAGTTTDALTEGVVNKYYTNTRVASVIAGTTTTALAEGTNLYFTNNRVASVIAGTTTDALAQGSTNKYYSDTLFATSLSATTTDALTQGSLNKYYSTTLFATDLAGTTTTALTEGANLYFTNARADARVVAGLAATTSVASITTLANLSLSATQLTNFGTPFYTFFHATTTDALAEGTTNKYYTDTRVASVIAGTTTTALAEGNNLYFTNARADTRIASVLSGTTTDALAQGVTNKYYSTNLFATDLAGTTTTALTEGANLYFTNNRVASVIAGTTTTALAEGTNLYFTNGRADTRIAAGIAGTTTTALAEGTNLYFTNNRVASVIAGTTTDALAQGSTNKYYSDSLVNTYINASTTIPKTYTTNTFTNSNTFTGGLTLATLDGPLQANNGVVSATTSVGVLYGGTGLFTAPTYGQILVGNSVSGYTLSATSSLKIALSDTTGTLAVARGGTGLTSYTAGTVLYASDTGILAGTSTANLKTTLALNNVENTALSTWAGTSNLTTVGALTAGSIGGSFGSINIGSNTITSGLINGQTISSTANFTGTLAISGAITSTATVANTFPYASTTAFTASGTGYFGNLYTTASSTFANIIFANATGTSATTTNFFATTASSTNIFATNVTSGTNTFGTILATGSTTLQNFTAVKSTTTNATSTTIFATTASSTNFFATNVTSGTNSFGTILARASTTLQNVTFRNATGTSATTTNFFATTLTATNGLLTNATTSILAVTGLSTTTFAAGIDLTTGCFSVAGICVGGSSGGGTSSGVSGSLQFADGAGGFLADGGNLFWDNTSKYLGINTAVPGYPLDVSGTAHATTFNGGTLTDGTLSINAGGITGLSSISDGVSSWSSHNLSGFNSISGSTLTDGAFSVTGGTITGATWNGNAIGAAYGGTGINSSASTGVALVSSGSWSIGAVDISSGSNVTGTLAVGNGGTGATSFTAGSLVFSDGTNLTQDNSNLYWNNTTKSLGIGTNNVQWPFTTVAAGNGVTGSAYTNAAFIQDQTNYRGIELGYDTSGETGLILAASNGTASNIAFWNFNGSGWGETARIDGATGNFGIGTTSPGSLLSVGNTNGINFSTATSTFSSTGGIDLASGCFSIAGTCVGAGASQWTTSGSDIYYTTGNVGIGTTTPGQKLSVAGDILGNALIGSYITATSSSATSTFAGTAHVGVGTIADGSIFSVTANAGGSVGGYGSDLTTGGSSLGTFTETMMGGGGNDAIYDDNLSTYGDQTMGWISSPWTGYDLGSGNDKDVRRIAFSNFDLPFSITWELQYSDNGSAWTPASGSPDFTTNSGTDSTPQIFDFSSSGAHRYWRVIYVSGSDPSQTMRIADIQMMEYISGSAGTLAAFDVTNTGNVGVGTTSPGQKLSVAGDVLGNAFIGSYFNATSSVASVFPYASTTALSVSGTSYFTGLSTLANLYVSGSTTLQAFTFVNATGTSATTTNFFATTASSTNLFANIFTSGTNILGTIFATGSSTLQNFTFVNATGTSATTTNFFATTASSTNIFATNVTSGTNTFGTILARASTTLQNFTAVKSTTTNATSTTIFATTASSTNLYATNLNSGTNTFGTIFATGSSTLQAFTFTNATGTSATTTNFFATTASSTNLFATNVTSGTNTFGTALHTGSTTLQNFTFVNATGTSATTTNFFATTASSTNLFTSNLGVGTSSPATTLAVSGSGYFTTGLGVGLLNTTTGTVKASVAFDTLGAGTYKINGTDLVSASTTYSNYFFGTPASTLQTTMTGTNNIGLGVQTLYTNVSGQNSVAIGYQALRNATSSIDNEIAIGYQAMMGSSANGPTGIANIAIGNTSLSALTTGTYNTAVGYGAGAAITSASQNVAFGAFALLHATSTGGNTAIGYNAMNLTTSGGSNVAIGTNALLNNITGNSNITIGSGAEQYNGSASSTVAIGYGAAIGAAAYNAQNFVAIGESSFAGIATGGDGNVGVGYRTGYLNTTGSENVFLGDLAGVNNTTGSHNVAVGQASAPSNNTGSYNVFLGYGAGSPLAGDSYYLNLGNIIYGTSTNNSATTQIGIGTTTPTARFAIKGLGTTGRLLAFSDSNSVERLTMFDNGKLGIGTTSPGQLLSVAGDILGNNIIGSYFTATSTTASTFPYASSTALTVSGTAYIANLIHTGSTTLQNFTFVNATGTSATTTNFFATTASSTNLFASTATFNTASIGNTLSVTGLTTLGYASTTALTSSQGAWLATSASANVGIGSTTPAQKLSVVGDIYGDSGIGAGVVETIDGRITANTGFNATDNASTSILKVNGSTILHTKGAPSYVNTFIGINTGSSANVSAQYDYSLGFTALRDLTSGSYNIAIGTEALQTATSGSSNVAVGTDALQGVNAVIPFNYNTAVGHQAGRNATGDSNVFLGYGADTTSGTPTTTKSVAIGYGAIVGCSNCMVLGGTAASGNNVNVGIGTSTPVNNLLDLYSTSKSAIGFSGASGSTYKWTIGMDVTNGGRFSIASSTALGTTDRFVISGAGNVGIGTTSPGQMLSVAGDILGNVHIGTYFTATSTSVASTFPYASTTALTSSQGAWLATSASANVGIGSTTPAQKLSVVGDIYGDSGIGAGVVETIDGRITANTGFNASTNASTSMMTLNGSTVMRMNGGVNSSFPNIFFGKGAGNATVSGDSFENLGLGLNALTALTSGDYNVAVGSSALGALQGGSQNTALGQNALGANVSGNYNTGLGQGSLSANTGDGNTAVGLSAGAGNLSGTYNTALGYNAFGSSGGTTGTGNANIAIGSAYSGVHGPLALGIVTGNYNIALGTGAIRSNTSGSGNIGLGQQVLDLTTTGSNNYAIGYQAGNTITTGSKNVIIGYDADTLLANDSYYLNIANILYGTSTNNTATTQLGVGTTTPSARFSITAISNTTGRAFALSDSNNVEKFTILDNGKVGIGTTSPGQLLSVAGDILGNNIIGSYFTATSTTASTFPYASSTALTVSGTAYIANLIHTGSTTLQNFTFVNATGTSATTTNFFATTASSTNLFSSNLAVGGTVLTTSGGSVGVGTASPSTKLEVNGTFRAGNTSDTYMTYDSSADNLTLRKGSYNISFGYDDSNGFAPTINTVNGTGVLTINATSTILKTGPTANLVNTLKLENTGGTIGSTATAINFRAGGNVGKGIVGYTNQSVWGVGDLFLGVNGVADNTVASASDAKLTIQGSSGNVGIGTTSPYAKLSISANSTDTYNSTLFAIASSTGGTSTTTTFTVLAGGNVGIGTSTPGQKLSVAGDILGNNIIGSYFTATSTTATSTFAGGLTIETTGFVYDLSTNNVGIGTSSPSARLSVAGDILGNIHIGTYFIATSTTASTFTGGFLALASSTLQNFTAVNSTTTNATTTTFFATTASSTNLFTSNLGVGTSSPISAFAVTGTSTFNGAVNNLISNSNSPILIASTTAGFTNGSGAMAIQGKYAYVVQRTTTGNFGVFDITTPSSPVLLATTTVNTGPASTYIGITVSGNFAYLSDRDQKSIVIVDISNPLSPVARSSIAIDTTIGGPVINPIVSGRYLYITGHGTSDNLYVVDIASSTAPVILSTMPLTATGTIGMVLRQKYLFVANRDSTTLTTVDISNPASTTISSIFTLPFNPVAIVTNPQSKFLFVFNNAGATMAAIDVSNPASPVTAYSGTIGSGIMASPTIAGRYIYAVQNSKDVIAIDISSSTAPYLAGKYSGTASQFSASGAVAVGRNLFVDSGYGLQVFDLNGTETASLTAHSFLAGNADVLNTLTVGGIATINTGLNVGFGGIMSQGGFANQGNAFFGGNLGIGTTSPYAQLAVVGPSSTTTVSTLALKPSSSQTANILDIYSTASTPVLTSVITSAGNWGIGTTSPGQKLSVAGDILGNVHIGTYFTATSTSVASTFPYASTTVVSSTGSAYFATSGGNVGIGTSLPTFGFVVSTSTVQNTIVGTLARFLNTTGTDGLDIVELGGAGAYGGIRALSGDDLSLQVMNGSTATEGIRISNATGKVGNVGIGTTTPNNKLDIYSTTQSAIGFSGASGSTYKWTIGMDVTNGGRFSIASSTALGTTDRFVISGAGNVGIGTTSPGQMLSVAGDILGNNFIGSYFTATSTTATSYFAGKIGVGTTTPNWLFQLASTTASNTMKGQLALTDMAAGADLKHWVFASEGGALYFATSTDAFATSTVPALMITKNGNVGIGTTSPYLPLSVYGGAAATYFVGSATTSTTTLAGSFNVANGAMFYDNSGAYTSIDNLQTGAQSFDTNAGIVSWVDVPVTSAAPASTIESYSAQVGGTSLLTVYGESDGAGGVQNLRVGIGSTSPTQMLTVTGGVNFTGIAAGAGTAYVCSTVTTGVLSTSTTACNPSSIRFKENVENLSADRGLAGVLRMRPVTYTYKPDMAISGQQVGFIAEEMVGIVPEAVGFDSQGLPSNIDYAKLTPILAKAIQELATTTAFISNEWASTTPVFAVTAEGNIGIGTSTPAYKLQVMGDIAATSFVNISTRDAKKDISYLSASDDATVLEKIKALNVATYRYNIEPNSNPLRMGLIAEEAPSEILAVGGKGVDIYKLSSFILAGVKAQQSKLESLETRIARLEANQSTGGTQTQSVGDYLSQMGVQLSATVAQFKTMVVDALTVGSSDKPSGITLYDEVTKQPYCLKIANGATVTAPGVCTSVSSAPSIPETSTTTPSLPSGTATSTSSDTIPPVISLNGNNPATVQRGATYLDPGATVTDNVNDNLGVTTVGGEIDTTIPGEYTVHYSATDAAGNTASTTRTVIVTDSSATNTMLNVSTTTDVSGTTSTATTSDTVTP